MSAKLNEREDELDTSDGQSKQTSLQMQLRVTELKQWIENEAGFYGRTDKKFLVRFLLGCKFNVEKAKINMTKYYENRRKFPQWWANRDVSQQPLLSIAQLKLSIALKDRDANRPTIAISMCSRLERRSYNFDNYLKFHTIILETTMRRANCQANGLIWIVDVKAYPLWIVAKVLFPFFIRDILSNLMSMSLRMKSVHLINSPPISLGIWPLTKAFLSHKLKDRVFFYGSNWDELFDHVSIDDMPEEYGGRGGPLALHEDAFTEEMFTLNEDLVDDGKYGHVKSNPH